MNGMEWSPDQEKALTALRSGRSCFITGGGGTGKSTLVRAYCEEARVAKLAMTGAAAVLIGGQTVHSFFGMPPHVHKPKDVTNGKTKVSNTKLKRIASFDAILIDEVSMMRVDMFQFMIEVLNVVTKMRGGRRIQLICCGDFAQLPPVVTDEERQVLRSHYGNDVFAFQHPAWASLEVHELDVIHRQSKDEEFARWLKEVRHGAMRDASILDDHVAPARPGAVLLSATNAEANRVNDAEMAKLRGRPARLKGKIQGSFNPRNVRVPEELVMKKGARVIICKNDQHGAYVNGSTGEIIALGLNKKGALSAQVLLDSGREVSVTPATWEEISYERDADGDYEPRIRGTYTQMPLLPGWAITIHRSQGMTLESVHVDLSKVFETGQAYVALSRATSLAGLTLAKRVRVSDLFPHPLVAAYHHSLSGEIEPEIPFA